MQARRSERVYLRVPILVQGPDATRGTFSEVTSTVNIGRSGALIPLRSKPAKGAELQLTNLSTKHNAIGVVITQRSIHGDACCEFGIEISQNSKSFWGIEFEDPPQSDQFHIAGLVVCMNCLHRVFAYLSQSEYLSLNQDFSVRRPCPDCGDTTGWTVCSADEDTYGGEADQPRETETPGTGYRTRLRHPSEQRGAVRYALKVPVHVVGPEGSAEDTLTEDLSKTGMMFACRQKFEVGGLVRAILGYGVSNSPAMMTCKVVRRSPEGETKRYRYGVMIESLESSRRESKKTKHAGAA